MGKKVGGGAEITIRRDSKVMCLLSLGPEHMHSSDCCPPHRSHEDSIRAALAHHIPGALLLELPSETLAHSSNFPRWRQIFVICR